LDTPSYDTKWEDAGISKCSQAFEHKASSLRN